jgi:hypothetical protein
MNLLHAIVLAIVEGLTEFLPVSSTGHMIIGSTAMGIASDPFVKVFTVAIQFGAILSVLVLYWKRFFQSLDFYVKLFVAFLPAVFFGLLFKKVIDRLLENIVVVGMALVAGGIVFLFLDGFLPGSEPKRYRHIRHQPAQGAENRLVSGHRHGAGRQPVGGHHHRRTHPGAVAQNRCRVFVFSGRAHHVCRYLQIALGLFQRRGWAVFPKRPAAAGRR